MSRDADAVRARYEERPYTPPAAGGAPLLLSTSWLDGVAHPHAPVLHPGARVLVAGCGTGTEVANLAASVPDGEVVGVDFSASAIAVGRARGLPDNARLVHADLTEPGLAERLGSFDLVTVHAVADYVPDADVLLATLAACTGPHGVVWLAANRPAHPRARIRAGLAALGQPFDRLEDGPSQGAAVRTLAALLGEHGGDRLADLDPTVLEADVLGPFAHHQPLRWWAERASAQGLIVAASLAVPLRLAAVGDAELPVLYPLSDLELVLLVDDVRLDPAFTTLLARRPKQRPAWPELGTWIPHRDPSLDGLAPVTDARTATALTVRQQGWPDLQVPVRGGVIELLRRADGATPIDTLREGLPLDAAALVAGLFRATHAGLVRWSPGRAHPPTPG